MHKYSYWRRLPHIQKNDRPVFVTFCTYRRWILPTPERQEVLNCCIYVHERYIRLHAAVVMPDHVHLIFTPLRDSEGWPFSLPEIMRMIKGRAARRVNLALGRSGQVWQEEFFDHVLRSNDSLAEKASYVCQNPVRAGLVSSEAEYAWLWKGEIPAL